MVGCTEDNPLDGELDGASYGNIVGLANKFGFVGLDSRLEGFCDSMKVGGKLEEAVPKGGVDKSFEGKILCDAEKMLGKVVGFPESEGKAVGLANKFVTGRLD